MGRQRRFNQPHLLHEVWQPLGVIDAHRPAHDDQTIRVIPLRRDGISFVNAHVPGRQPLRAEGVLDRAECLARNVLHHQNCVPVRVTRAQGLRLLEAGGLFRAAGGIAGTVGMGPHARQLTAVDDQIPFADGAALEPALQDLPHAGCIAGLG
jgi:hypothetical protein